MRPPISSTSLQQIARPEAGAAVFAGPRAVDLLEGQEDGCPVFPPGCRSPYRSPRRATARNFLAGVDRDADDDVPLFRELDRIADQVDEHLPQPRRISDARGRERPDRRGGRFRVPAYGRPRPSDFRMPATESRRPNSTDSMSSLPASILEKSRMLLISDKQRFGRFLDDRQIIALLGVDRCVEQELGHAEDGIHRRADLMAHVGDERAFGPVGLVGRLFGRLELGLRLFLRRDVDHEAQAAVAASLAARPAR